MLCHNNIVLMSRYVFNRGFIGNSNRILNLKARALPFNDNLERDMDISILSTDTCICISLFEN